ncbi:MAG: LCP family protein [Selenomonadales bacterium]|nr:LCP family protein [Selenomonadales bacterium]
MSDNRRVVRKKPRKKKPLLKRLRWKRVFVALAVLAMLIWGIGMACNWAYHAARDMMGIETTVEETVPEEPVQVVEEPAAVPVRTVPVWSASALASATADEKKAASQQTINVLLLGVDDTAQDGLYGQADSAVLFVVNTEDETAAMVSIPSDTRIPLEGRTEAVALKDIYRQGGTPLALRMVEGYLGITIPYYATVDHAVFTQVLDELGGIDLYVEKDMSYTDSYDGFTIDLKKGYQTLDGEKAQQYIRYRDPDIGEFGRMKRQQRLVKAIIDQHATVGTMFDVPSILSILSEQSDTNLTFYPLLRIANVLSEYQSDMMFGEILPGQSQSDAQGSYWSVDPVKVDAIFHRIFKIEPPPQEEKAPEPTPAPTQEEANKEDKKESETTTNKTEG